MYPMRRARSSAGTGRAHSHPMRKFIWAEAEARNREWRREPHPNATADPGNHTPANGEAEIGPPIRRMADRRVFRGTRATFRTAPISAVD